MKILIKTISYIGLILTIGPSILVFTNVITLENHKLIALIGSLMWFASAPFWLNKQKKVKEI